MGSRIDILAVGALSRDLKPAFDHYARLLTPLCDLGVHEVREYALHGRPEAQVLRDEGRRLLAAWPRRGVAVALAVEGATKDSPVLASALQDWLARGGATFVIGGSLGLAPEVLARADERLSLSRLTLPHQLARVVLVEQVFRALKIARREPYHH
ncbi:MAG TPA: 23S rRNA (pseudouridine(1915)-N(3))-methyltransferase RlmH [Thermoleophilia bacterium]|nr:23S rRNA (pseudouridine(1915)-N(3))-methyltransferase RlmH [Thermoleophilia bacterium]HQG03755.1 23S rRNA (pseudouridine(1915)-N(3))-methyltransferase RlmH [Thermoleophilia bacterium]HQG54142.1 23S rRNA (pseudouridine(1915)-N(3))-methyltransferase RlmH [Thermoleophilia bacterium]HQJ98136.1 23S rRNA (pseudouridine(1915)-N(3))-methyltransferase RlmH [Thermoleophilia bacterium]